MEENIRKILEAYDNQTASSSGEFIVAWNNYEPAIVLNVKTGTVVQMPYDDYVLWSWIKNDAELMARADHVLDIIDPKTGKHVRTVQGYF